MENKYIEASRICREALREFKHNVNEYLPDNPESMNLVFAGAGKWDLEACQYIQGQISSVVDTILSTCMSEHCAYDLRIVQEAYASAVKAKDIGRCQQALVGFMKEAHIVYTVCKSIPKQVGMNPVI